MNKYFLLFLLLIAYGSTLPAQEDGRKKDEPTPDTETKVPLPQGTGEPPSLPYSLEGIGPQQMKSQSGLYTYRPPAPRRGQSSLLPSRYTPFLFPTALISYGVMAQFNPSLQSLDRSTHHEVTEEFSGRWRIDDYTQFLPAAAVYGLELTGLKPKHSFRDRTFVMATSHLIMATAVQSTKRLARVERPDDSDKHSFPSGHTATAFTGAQILFREYRDTSPWIAVGGYAAAGITGTMRVINKKHWVSDVVAGAGVGILSAEIGYLLLPVFRKTFGNSAAGKQFVMVPTAAEGAYGVGMCYTF
ncbi:MAG: phosphatase PAP2 family protein [Bacteroides sp.]|nr:phosphatase PAP2 family protein [Bacteroides sp.]